MFNKLTSEQSMNTPNAVTFILFCLFVRFLSTFVQQTCLSLYSPNKCPLYLPWFLLHDKNTYNDFTYCDFTYYDLTYYDFT